MTEKEFEQLKVGDKVWIVTDWFNKSNEGMKAVELEVKGKEDDEQIIQFLGVCFKAEYCSLTKSEAWEKAIKRFEEALKSQEQEVEKDRKLLDRYKAELAKAKEEERRKEWWYVSYKEQTVAKLPLAMDSDAEAEIFETEREAYEALAKFYERKLFKALEKCGYKFAICCDKNIAAVKINEDSGKFYWGYCYPHLSYGSICKANVFDTLDEAEAELERRKRND